MISSGNRLPPADTAVDEENEKPYESATSEYILKLIQRCAETQGHILDLSSKQLTEVPESLLKLDHLEYLYMEGNQLKFLPGNFFDCLHNLKWLDLRNNQLVTIPNAYIGRHKMLRHLLLEGNHLETLPLELGLVPTLEGLNIANNPLQFPPGDIIIKGTRDVLRYFRQILKAKSLGRIDKALVDGEDMEMSAVDKLDNDEEKNSEGEASAARITLRPSSASSVTSEVTGLSAALHRQPSYSELRSTKLDRLKKAGASGQVEKKQQKSKDTLLSTLPPNDRINERLIEHSKKLQERTRNESVDKLLQKVKNAESVSGFREKARSLQRKKEIEKRVKGKLDYIDAVDAAPFDIDPDHIQMISSEERIKEGVKKSHERVRRVLSPSVIKRLEEARIEKEQELRDKLKQHTVSMKERRLKPKGTPQDEMDAAIRELEIAKRLQQELDRRRKDLDYRFKAFAPDALLLGSGKRTK